MKNCISRIKQCLVHLWRTICMYVRRICHIRDYTGDGKKDILISTDSRLNSDNQELLLTENKDKEELNHE